MGNCIFIKKGLIGGWWVNKVYLVCKNKFLKKCNKWKNWYLDNNKD